MVASNRSKWHCLIFELCTALTYAYDHVRANRRASSAFRCVIHEQKARYGDDGLVASKWVDVSLSPDRTTLPHLCIVDCTYICICPRQSQPPRKLRLQVRVTLAHLPSHNTDMMTDGIVSQKYFDDCLEFKLMPTLMPGCQSEQAAARVLGYTPVSWDNLSGGETQPWSSIKSWAALTEEEKAAAAVLGYIRPTWDNRGRFKPKPVSAMKMWSKLRSCANGEITVRLCIERLVSVKVRTWFSSSTAMLLSTHMARLFLYRTVAHFVADICRHRLMLSQIRRTRPNPRMLRLSVRATALHICTALRCIRAHVL